MCAVTWDIDKNIHNSAGNTAFVYLAHATLQIDGESYA